MADLTISGAVVPTTTPRNLRGEAAGEALGIFQPVYRFTDGTMKKAACHTSDAVAAVVGITLMGAGAGQVAVLVDDGEVDLGAVILSQGKTYFLSHNSGKIKPEGDLATGDRVVQLGRAKTGQIFKIEISNTLIVTP